MDKEKILKSLQELRKTSQKRNFTQTFELIIALKNLDLKKPAHQVEFFGHLTHRVTRPKKICALVGPEIVEKAKPVFATVISSDDFEKYSKDKKLLKKLAIEHDFFVAQGDIMMKVAQYFGRILGPKGKMPNPKAGCVITPSSNLQQVNNNLQLTQKVSAKLHLMTQIVIGREDMKDEEMAQNAVTVFNQLLHALPNERQNIKTIYLKTTMGKPIKINFDGEIVKAEDSEKKKEGGKTIIDKMKEAHKEEKTEGKKEQAPKKEAEEKKDAA